MPQRKRPEARSDGEAPAGRPTGAYFLSLTVENVRCFGPGPQTLDLRDPDGRPARWTVILGNNGNGKTTLLQALAFLAETRLRHSNRRKTAFDPDGSGHRDAILSHAGAQTSSAFAADSTITCSLSAEVNGTARLDDVGRSRFMTLVSELDPLGSSTRFSPPANDVLPADWPPRLVPCCFGYGAGRRATTSTLRSDLGHLDPLVTLVDESVDLRDAEEWLLRLDYSASKPSEIQDQQRDRLDRVKRLLADVLPDVEEVRITQPDRAKPTPSVEFLTPDGWVPLARVGYGYRTTVVWLVDFMSRMVEHYPDSPDPLGEPAVVLVDEVDLHLHPSWQRKLMGLLSGRFPNTQFVVTAHSPLFVQAAAGEAANLAVLRRDPDKGHVVIDNDPAVVANWRVDQVLTSDLFGLESARPPQIVGAMEERKRLLTKAKPTAADRRRVEALEREIGPLPTGETAEDAETRRLLEESLRLLRRRASANGEGGADGR